MFVATATFCILVLIACFYVQLGVTCLVNKIFKRYKIE